MFALIKRNTKIYFANKPGVIMSCFGALISFQHLFEYCHKFHHTYEIHLLSHPQNHYVLVCNHYLIL